MWLGLIPSLSAVPGHTLPTGLAGLTLLFPIALWARFRLTWVHWAFGAFLVYALISIRWSPASPGSAVWQLAIWAFGIAIGSWVGLRQIWIGLALGLSVSSLLALVQSMGFISFPGANPPGLYFNSMLHGNVLALVILGLVVHRLWWFIPALVPGFILSQSRGGLAILAIGLLANLRWNGLVLLTTVLAIALALTISPGASDMQRLEIWQYAWSLLTPLGNGLGSFMELHYHTKTEIIQPQFVHNDYLQLVFEYGLGAIPFFAILLGTAFYTHRREWPVLIACLTLACFAFPFYTPITAFIWAFALGSTTRTA